MRCDFFDCKYCKMILNHIITLLFFLLTFFNHSNPIGLTTRFAFKLNRIVQ